MDCVASSKFVSPPNVLSLAHIERLVMPQEMLRSRGIQGANPRFGGHYLFSVPRGISCDLVELASSRPTWTASECAGGRDGP